MSDRGKICCSHVARDLWLPLHLGLLGPTQPTETESPSAHPQGEHPRCPQKSMRRRYNDSTCVVSAKKFARLMDGLAVNDLDGTVD
jgi:hypothetical protein